MRINIDISNKLHNILKVCVALKGQTMRYYVIEAIKSKMKQEQTEQKII
jgi:hypothetical protein